MRKASTCDQYRGKMRNKLIVPVIISALATSFSFSPASAQGLISLLEKLENLEKRLSQLETNKKNEIGKVQDQLAKVEFNPYSSHVDSSISLLGSRVDRISEDLERIRVGAKQPEEAEEVASLSTEFRALIGELRGTLKRTSQAVPPVGLELQLDSKLSPIEISGFGDFSYAARQAREEGDNLSLGQVEVDLETVYNERIVLTAAIAFDPRSESFGLGQFTVDFHLFGSEGDHYRSAGGINHSGIMVGQFDVPFGLDWQVYPSIERKMVTGPVAVAGTHDYWNDVGVQAYAANKWFNAVVFGVNGFGYGELEMNMAVGGRLGLKPHQAIELGASYAGFLNGSNKLDMSMTGFDLQLHYQAFSFKEEYIAQKIGLAGKDVISRWGFYGEGLYEFGRFFLVGRYDKFSPGYPVEAAVTRISGGGGLVVLKGVEIRLEYQVNYRFKDATLLQVVVGF